MKIEKTILKNVLIITPKKHEDERGFFKEIYHQDRYYKNGIPGNNLKFVQDNHSFSTKGVIRGMHFQLSKPQGKLVSVISGEVFDVVVDINPKSPNFKKWIGVNLSSKNGKQLWIPPGYAHGFMVISESADFIYKCTELFDSNLDIGFNYNDSEIGIDWPLKTQILSNKDRSLPSLSKVLSNINIEKEFN